ncbi:phosphonate metabolism protein PhnP [Oligella urethralis]|nr:phosphonate metabolism protein PhnP [Oligella urethralis]
MRFTVLGTGSASQLPVYNCRCLACERARADSRLIRRPASAMLQIGRDVYLFDSGLMDLRERFPMPAADEVEAPRLTAIFQTHYHADHAQGLLSLRWGEGMSLPVYGPDDAVGFADLYKHPGILDFSHTLAPFQCLTLVDNDTGSVTVTALPLEHSRPTLGYLIEVSKGKAIAYLTDTKGLSPEVLALLRAKAVDYVLVDCTYPPGVKAKGHHHLHEALALVPQIPAKAFYLTHIDHSLETYLIQHPEQLPTGVQLAQDGMCFDLSVA